MHSNINHEAIERITEAMKKPEDLNFNFSSICVTWKNVLYHLIFFLQTPCCSF